MTSRARLYAAPEKLAKHKANQRAWYIRNKARLAEARTKNIEAVKEQAKVRYAKTKERVKARVQEWRLRNPEKCRRYSLDAAKRRRSVTNRTPPWANRFFMTEAYSLARLRTKLTGFLWEVDHIVPLQHPMVCGLHVEHNLQVIPSAVNKVKGNRLDQELATRRAPCLV